MFCRNPQNGRYVWTEFFISMAHCLLRALDLFSIGADVLHLQRGSCWKKYFICIDKRIAILELLTQRHKLRSQLPYLSCKFGIVREFVSKPSFYFCYSSFIKRVQTVTLNHLKKRYSAHLKGILTSLKCFSSQFIHLILAGFILTNPIFSRDYFLNILNVSSKTEGAKSRRGNCLVLPHASYGPAQSKISCHYT